MRGTPHDRAEVLAGAITLGEATDDERIEYRRHIAECGPCLASLGGERELERLTAHVSEARESEVWEPDVRGPLLDRVNTAPRRVMRYSIGILGVALIVSLLGHFAVGSMFTQTGKIIADPLVINYEGNKIVLERRSVRDAHATVAAAPKPLMVVSHNVVMMQRPQLAAPSHANAALAALKARGVVHEKQLAYAPPPDAVAQSQSTRTVSGASGSNVPPWRRAQEAPHNGAAITGAGLGAAHAESLQIAATYSTRDPEPLGGETAINPRPTAIAYQEGAEGTTAFEVMIDENGNPTKCIISKSSNWPVLDEAVCKAAMQTKYKPKTLNGHAVPGIYRDAFTFRPQPQQN